MSLRPIMVIGLICALAVLAIGSVTARAPLPRDARQPGCSACNSILAGGVFDTVLTKSESSLEDNLFEWLTKTDEGAFQAAQKSGLKIGLPVEGVPLEIGATHSSSQFKQWRQSLAQGKVRRFTTNEAAQVLMKTASPIIAEKWLECVRHTCGAGNSAYGLVCDLRATATADQFLFIPKWVPIPGVPETYQRTPKVLPSGFILTGATANTPLPEGTDIPTVGRTLMLTRQGASGITIALSADMGLPCMETIPAKDVTPKLPPISLSVFSATSGKASHPSVDVRVPDGFKVIGGGARTNWTGEGSLLTASYPSSTSTWRASAKDHAVADPATVTAWAIAVADPKDEWDVVIYSATGAAANHPSAAVTVSHDFLMTGGGGQAHAAGYGSLLTASFPRDSSTWEVRGKDHLSADVGQVTAYAIGVQPKNGAAMPPSQIFSVTSGNAQHPSTTLTVGPGFRILSGGALVNWTGWGNLLTGSFPSGNSSWEVRSKDHREASPATITAYVIGLKVN